MKPSSMAGITMVPLPANKAGAEISSPRSSRTNAMNANQVKPGTPSSVSTQAAPLRWFEKRFPQRKQKTWLFLGSCFLWALAIAMLSTRSIAPVKVDGVYQPVHQLSCTDSLWLPDNGCGLNGDSCPYEGGFAAFHCPENCAKVKLQKPQLVGLQSVVDQPLIIGGPIYRADSWICASAIHAGIVENSNGGCGVLRRMPQTNSYRESRANVLSSIELGTYFPQSFKFKINSDFDCEINDQTAWLPYISVLFTAAVFMLSNGPLVPFFTLFVVGFVHIKFLSDDSIENQHHGLVNHIPSGSTSALSAVITSYLPALLCAIVVYRFSGWRILHRVSAQVEAAFLWLGTFWAGLLYSPDIYANAFAVPCLLAIAASHQMYYLHQEGTLFKSVPLYIIFSLAFGISSVVTIVPALFLVLAALVLPAAALQTRTSLIYSGLLFGLLVHGLASHNLLSFGGRTTASTSSGLSHLMDISPPAVNEPLIFMNTGLSNITFTLNTPPPSGVDAISMLVNDVERGRNYFNNKGADKLVWIRGPQTVPDYIRFSWVKDDELLGYGEAGVWEVAGLWTGLGGWKEES